MSLRFLHNDIVFDLDVTTFLARSMRNFMNFVLFFLFLNTFFLFWKKNFVKLAEWNQTRTAREEKE